MPEADIRRACGGSSRRSADCRNRQADHCSERVSRQNEVLDVVADVSRAERELQWRPTIGMHDGLARIIRAMHSALAGRSVKTIDIVLPVYNEEEGLRVVS